MKRVFSFGSEAADCHSTVMTKDVLGGKGANLADMSRLGVPIPPGFTISTQCCLEFYRNRETLSLRLQEEVLGHLKAIETHLKRNFGDPEQPLLVSVRSGARASMPGMMDTILNLGLNDRTVVGLAKRSENERFAFDAYRRLIQMYSDVVLGIHVDLFEELIAEKKRQRGILQDTDLLVLDLKELVEQFKVLVSEKTGAAFPENPFDQLWGAISAVFRSWNSKRAVEYRKIERIPDDWGTAVTVQSMVFGNMGEDSATGVGFSRNPSTGERIFFGEYLTNAQGEDVVAGIRTPMPINAQSQGLIPHVTGETLETKMPEVYQQLAQIVAKLEAHYKDMQDIEFTVERQCLYLLQTRSGKRAAKAALKIALQLYDEKQIALEEMLRRISPRVIDQLLHPQFNEKAKQSAQVGGMALGQGLPASPGAASGNLYLSADTVQERFEKGEETILVRAETSPEDIHGMHRAQGILTARGGMTSHAAVVARGMGKTCVVGCGEMDIDYKNKTVTFRTLKGAVTLGEGERISIDGSTGEIFRGAIATQTSSQSPDFDRIMDYCDEIATLKVRANADTPQDAEVARSFGAKGIGLCRTEHMFFGEDRIRAFRQMILAHDEAQRRAALTKILPLQKNDFMGIFRAMRGFPVTIRLLDPPLHEFLPHGQKEIEILAKDLKVSVADLEFKIRGLQEANPMLGHRGCRLAISYPEIYEVQARAIFEAACELVSQEGFSKNDLFPEIMIPLVALGQELKILRQLVDQVADTVFAAAGLRIPYQVGTMIELPRAALTAEEIAPHADFFSFGTNDLTQTTFGFSRDDSSRFLPFYINQGIFSENPFVSLDEAGVGELIRIGLEKGRQVKKDLRASVCGEHGGDPASVKFCHHRGLNYVSCSPYRVPIARLSAAQAVLEGGDGVQFVLKGK